jgi:hypothetical protein
MMSIRLDVIEAWAVEHQYFLIGLAVIAVVIGRMKYTRWKEQKDFERYMNQKR